MEDMGKLVAALAKSQAEFQPVKKKRTAKVKGVNKKTNAEYDYSYKYADYSDILAMALPILSKNGIAFCQRTVRREQKLSLVSEVRLGDAMIGSDGIYLSENFNPQEFGSMLSYWKRYDGCALLGIQADSDDDGALATKASRDAKYEERAEERGLLAFEIKGFEDACNKTNKTESQKQVFYNSLGCTKVTEIKKSQFPQAIKWASDENLEATLKESVEIATIGKPEQSDSVQGVPLEFGKRKSR